jgi:hypothetical protein
MMLTEDDRRPFATLQRFAQRAARAADAARERCELCGEPIPDAHRHLLEPSTHAVRCVCQACSLLFGKEAASAGKYRLIPDRRLCLEDFVISDAQWDALQVPVGLAFFFHSTPADRVLALYPGPAVPTESLLTLDAWKSLEESNPSLKALLPDVEALLVNRARGAREYYLVPIDECFGLVGVIRTHWRGLGGGQDVWKEIAAYFAALRARCRGARRANEGEDNA